MQYFHFRVILIAQLYSQNVFWNLYHCAWKYICLQDLQLYIDRVRQLYTNVGKDRKQVADIIKNDKFKYFGFKSIDTNFTAEEMLNDIRTKNISNYANLISDYESNN